MRDGKRMIKMEKYNSLSVISKPDENIGELSDLAGQWNIPLIIKVINLYFIYDGPITINGIESLSGEIISL